MLLCEALCDALFVKMGHTMWGGGIKWLGSINGHAKEFNKIGGLGSREIGVPVQIPQDPPISGFLYRGRLFPSVFG